jgi:hypothetical protein
MSPKHPLFLHALRSLAPTLMLDAVTLEGWLELAALQGLGDPPVEDDDPFIIPAVARLARALETLGAMPAGEGPRALLSLALLTDALDERSDPPSATVRAVHRLLLRSDELPQAHAACLLRKGAPLRWAALGEPEQSARISRLAHRLAAVTPQDQAATTEATLAELEQRRHALAWATLAARAQLPSPAALLDGALERAVRLADPSPFLVDRCRAAWEIQRGDVLGHGPVEGDLFLPLLLLEALTRAGQQRRGDLLALLRGRRGQGIRYYRNSPWLPHDTDVAGAVLLALPDAEDTPADLIPLRDEALAVLALGRQEDGSIHTWVQLPGQRADAPPEAWFGQTCAGVAARASRAAATARAWPPEALAESAAWLASLADEDGGHSSAYYPSRAVTTALVLEALAAMPKTAPDALERAAAWLEAHQALDGSWEGNTEATASAVLALDAADRLRPAVAAEAAAWLVRAQGCDGTWTGADFMINTQGDGELGPFGCTPLASAMAVAGLAAARRASAPRTAALRSS